MSRECHVKVVIIEKHATFSNYYCLLSQLKLFVLFSKDSAAFFVENVTPNISVCKIDFLSSCPSFPVTHLDASDTKFTEDYLTNLLFVCIFFYLLFLKRESFSKSIVETPD